MADSSPVLDPAPDDTAAPHPIESPAPADGSLMGKWTGYASAVTTGLLYFVAFPGVDFWPAAFIAWVPWLLALRGASPGRAALQGLWMGMTCGVLGFYWLLGMLQTFSGFPAYICAVFMLILVGYQSGIFALTGWLYARGVQRGYPAGLVFVGAFVAGETVFPLLFPFTFGASMHEVYPIVQMAELGGPIMVALVVLAPNWAFAKVLGRFIEAKRASAPISIPRAFSQIGWKQWLPLLCVPVVASIYGMIRIVQVDEAVRHAEKVRVGIVQANMGLQGKREDRSEGLRRHTDLSRKLAKEEKVDFVVWPETSVAGAVDEKRAFNHYHRNVTPSLRLGSDRRVPAIMGAVLFRDVEDSRGSVLFNSALISDDRGRIQGRYDKQFLLLFGEYLPFGDRFPILHEWSPQSGRFSPGTSFEPLHFRGHDIATFICYEDIVPSFVNKLMKHGDPELLVNMTNDAWFGDTSEPWEHMALAKMRAVEQRRFFVRSTNSGISGFVDPVGRLTKRTETFKQAAVAEEVAWLKLASPYRIWGNGPWWVLTALAFLFAFVARERIFARR